MTSEKPSTPKQQHNEALRPRDNTAEKRASAPVNPPVISEVPPRPPNPLQPYQGRYESTPLWKKILESAAVVAGVSYAIVAYLQWHEMKRATDAAKSAAETAHDALVKGNRPWLGVDGSATTLQQPTMGKEGIKASVGFILKNFGTAPALHVGMHAIIVNNSPPTQEGLADFSQFKRDADASCRMADLATKSIVQGEEGAGLYIFPNNSVVERLNGMTTTPAPLPIMALDLVGCIAYADQFKGIHHTRFCFMSENAIKDVRMDQRLISCPINEDAD
jgi:hypothetical protein